MNQFFSTVLNPSSRRVFFFYVLPGGSFNLILCLVFFEKDFQTLIDKYLYSLTSSSLYLTIFLCASIVIGLVFENLGSRWELNYCKYKVLKYITEDEDGVHKKIKDASNGIKAEQLFSFGWERFLSITYDSDRLNGHRFLRYMLERLKFELNFGIATYILYVLLSLKNLLLLLFVIFIRYEIIFNIYEIASIPILFLLSRYLLATEAPLSAQTLHECRIIIVTNNDCSWEKEIKYYENEKKDYKPPFKLIRFLWIRFLFGSLFLCDEFRGIKTIQKNRKRAETWEIR